MPDHMNDHDLLIAMKAEFSTKLDRVIQDVKDLNNNTAKRVHDLEEEKLDKEEANRIHAEYDKINQDHEIRIRANTSFIDNLKGRYIILGVIASILISVVVSLTVFGLQRLLISAAS